MLQWIISSYGGVLMGIIYKYTSPSGKSYIGQTVYDRKTREKNSKGSGYIGCTAFYQAIQYYGFENFSYDILEECEDSLLDEKERYYISLYNTRTPNGYNIKEGGNDTSSWSKKVYQFTREGKFIKEFSSLTEAAREVGCNISSISEVCLGRKKTCKNFQWSFTPEERKPIKKARNKTVYQFDEKGILIKEFESAKNAANFYKIPISMIHQCAEKKRIKRVGNTIFTYEPYVDWNFYSLKHKRNSTTIPNGSRAKPPEVLCPERSGEDIV